MNGPALRDVGHAQLELSYGVGDDYAARARAWIEARPIGSLVDADELRAACGTPFHANAPGAIVRRAALDGLLEGYGWKQSERTERRAAVLRVWRRTPADKEAP